MDTAPQPTPLADIFDDFDAEADEAALLEAEATADAGIGVPHDEVVAWVKSWDTDHELPIPIPRCLDL